MTVASFCGLPVQPVMPVSVLPLAPAYVQTASIPATVNMPDVPKPSADTSLSDVPRFSFGPSTFVSVACVTTALSLGFPLHPVIVLRCVPSLLP